MTTNPGSLDLSMLGIYLNDHLAGATSGVELARRIARTHESDPSGPTVRRIADEVADDRQALLDLMRRLGVPVRHYKTYAAWLVEKAGRAKPNGRLSPAPR